MTQYNLKGLLFCSVLVLSVSFVHGTPATLNSRSLLRARQDISSQCTSECSSLVDALDACAPDGDLNQLDPTCFCNVDTGSYVSACTSCIADADPSETSFAQEIQSEAANVCGVGTATSSKKGNTASRVSIGLSSLIALVFLHANALF